MSKAVKRAFKYRFYPTEEQARELLRTFGCVRHVYNRALEVRTAAWYRQQRRVSYSQTSAMLTEWKHDPETAWLSEVSSVPLQQSLRHLQSAFVAFWSKQAKYPRFKSRKRSRQSAEYTRSAFRWRAGEVRLAKVAGPLAIVWSRPLPEGAKPSTVTVSQDAAGRWFISIVVETNVQQLPTITSTVGIDAGISNLVTLSTGEKIPNPRHERQDRARLARAHRNLARKAKGSNNRAKARRKVARVYARMTDRRRDLLHKLSTRLVHENQVVVIEDLQVRNLLGRHSLARAISDASWAELRRMLEYKCRWYGRDLVVIDRWYPSSRTCSACGAIAEVMPLSCGSGPAAAVRSMTGTSTQPRRYARLGWPCAPVEMVSDRLARKRGKATVAEAGTLPGDGENPPPCGGEVKLASASLSPSPLCWGARSG